MFRSESGYVAREHGVSAPVLVELTRGGIVESQHCGVIAVARPNGRLLAGCGDVEQVTFPRSALKPFQALALVESGAAQRFGYGDAELAVACASHNSEPRHREMVSSMLERAGVPLSALRNGVVEPIDETEAAKFRLGLLEHNSLCGDCSGKHAGILAACVVKGYPLSDYDAIEHPIQREIRAIVAECFRMDPDELIVGIDGCTLPAFAAPLRNIATGWAGLADPLGAVPAHAAGLARLGAAMAAEPFMVAGTDRLNTILSEATAGRVVTKDGAEGVLCMAIRDRGIGVTFKLEDGSFRSHGVIAHAILRQLDALSLDEDARLSALFPSELHSHREQEVGEMRPVFGLDFA